MNPSVNWHELYLTGRTTLHEQMGNRAAAYAISSVYFITFIILMVKIILNLVLAVSFQPPLLVVNPVCSGGP